MERNENGISGPIQDVEIPVMEHLSELRRRLIVVLIPFCIVALVMFPLSNFSLRFLFSNLFAEDIPLYVYSPVEWISVKLLFSFLCALSITIPLILYEIFTFMRPGLYPSERNFFLLVVIPSLLLYVVGAFVAYFFVLPWLFSYLLAYSGDVAKVAYSANRIFSIILYTAVGFGLIFQIPLIMTLAVKMKLVTYAGLKDKRWLIYGLIFGLAFFIIADPMGISMLMAAVSIALFELGLLITKYIAHKRR